MVAAHPVLMWLVSDPGLQVGLSFLVGYHWPLAWEFALGYPDSLGVLGHTVLCSKHAFNPFDNKEGSMP